MKTKLFFIVIFLITSIGVKSQHLLELYSLRSVVPQAQNVQAAFVPENHTLSISVPFANVGGSFQSDFAVEDIFSKKNDGTNNYSYDFNNFLSKINRQSVDINTEGFVNILNIGFKPKNNSNTYYSIFANFRSKSAINIDKSIVGILDDGIGFGDVINFSRNAAFLNVFWEAGLGYSQNLKNVTFGFRVKYLNGMLNANMYSSANANSSLTIDRNDISISVLNAPVIYTSGFDIIENPDNITNLLLSNNIGFGIDLGLKYEINDWLYSEISLNDLGMIFWNDSTTKYTLNDVDVNYPGIIKTESFSLNNNDFNSYLIFDDVLDLFSFEEEKNQTYSQGIGSTFFFSTSAKVKELHTFSALLYKNNLSFISPLFYGASYTLQHKDHLISLVGTYSNKQIGIIGVSMATRLGPVQLYTLLNTNIRAEIAKVEYINNVSASFGLNLLFGGSKQSEKEKNK